jgi:hypothetical protein
LIFIQTCKTCHICNTVLIEIRTLLSSGVICGVEILYLLAILLSVIVFLSVIGMLCFVLVRTFELFSLLKCSFLSCISLFVLTMLAISYHVKLFLISSFGLGTRFFLLSKCFRRIMCYICRKLTKELCEVVEHYGLVNFTTLDIQVRQICLVFSFVRIKRSVEVLKLDFPFTGQRECREFGEADRQNQWVHIC